MPLNLREDSTTSRLANTLTKNPKFISGVIGNLSHNTQVVTGSNIYSSGIFDLATAAKWGTVGNANSIFMANNAIGVTDHQRPNFGKYSALILRGLSSTQCAALVASASADFNPIGQNRDGLTFIIVHRPRYGTSSAKRANNLFSFSQTDSGTTEFLNIAHSNAADPASCVVAVKQADGASTVTKTSDASFNYNETVVTAVTIMWNEAYGSDSGRVTVYKNSTKLNEFTGIFEGVAAGTMPTGQFQNVYIGSKVNPQTATRDDWYEGDIFFAGIYEAMTDAEYALELRSVMNMLIFGAPEAGPASGTIYAPVCLHIGPGDSNSADSGLYASGSPTAPLLRQTDNRRLGNQIIRRLPGGKRGNSVIIRGSHGSTMTRTWASFEGDRGGVGGVTPHYGGYPVIIWQAGRNDFFIQDLDVTADDTTDLITFTAGNPFSYNNSQPYILYLEADEMPGGLTANTGYWARRSSGAIYGLYATMDDAVAGTNLIDITSAGTNVKVVKPTPQNLYDFWKERIAALKASTTYHQSFGVPPIIIGETLICVDDDTAQADIDAFNTLLRAGFASEDIELDELVDTAADSRYDEAADCENTDWFHSDQTHFNEASIRLRAGWYAEKILTVIPTY